MKLADFGERGTRRRNLAADTAPEMEPDAATIRLVNAAMMPLEGTYTLRRLTPEQFATAVRAAASGGDLVSYIGYHQTAEHLSRLTGLEIPVNRTLCVLEDGDTLLICRLGYRVADPTTKGAPVPPDAWEYFQAQYRREEITT